MRSLTDMLTAVNQAFAWRDRPEHFTNYTHCEECAEHDATLRSKDRGSLSFNEVATPGSDPICFAHPRAFAYWLPDLIRLSVVEPNDSGEWYLPQLLSHLTYDGPKNLRVLECRKEERQVVLEFLSFIAEHQAKRIAEYGLTNDLDQAFDCWSDVERA